MVYGGVEARASFKSGEEWVEDENGYRTLEQRTTLLFDAETVTTIGLAQLTDIVVYPVGDDNGTPTTYRVRQVKNELDGLMKRAVLAS